MLRESSQANAEDINLSAVMTGGDAGKIDHSAALARLAEAVVNGDEHVLAQARDTLVQELGVEAMIDAAGVASNFQRMVRIADATGITLGAFEAKTEALRVSLGINQFAALS
jgi:hypothetical protein